jgi:hypothetical protein
MQAQHRLARVPMRGGFVVLVVAALVAFGVAAWIAISVMRGTTVVVQLPTGAGVQSASSNSAPADGGCQWVDSRKAC